MAISKEYRNAIQRLNYAKGKKSGDRGYIRPSDAVKKRSLRDVSAIEAAIDKHKTDKVLSSLVSKYNKYMDYDTSDAGRLTVKSARSIGISDMQEYVEQAKQNYTKEVKAKQSYIRKVKQSIKDEDKLKSIAQSANEAIKYASEKNKNLNMYQGSSETEYNELEAEAKKATENYKNKFIEFARAKRELEQKYRKANKLQVNEIKLNEERIKEMSVSDMIAEIDNLLKGRQGKDKYGNPATLYSLYHSQVTATVSSILSSAVQTKIEINGQEMILSDVINTDNIDNKKFWKAFHAWESDGGIVHSKDGRKYPNYISAGRFFSSNEGKALLKDIVKSEYETTNIKFID